MNPNLGAKVRQSLHGQLSGIQILIFVLNSATVSDAFISSGTISQILGARKESFIISHTVFLGGVKED